MIKLVVFDLDGTLAESKAAIDTEMASLLSVLLATVQVAVISGGGWPQFQAQLLSHLGPGDHLTGLSLLPTCGTKFYRYCGDWKLLYSEDLTGAEKATIVAALNTAAGSLDLGVKQTWGDVIEDRGSQITFSALGQRAPLGAKALWDPHFVKRGAMQAALKISIPQFSVRSGGTTSLDVTKPGIDKAYGMNRLRDVLGIELDEMLFIGDALYPGGNDRPVRDAGVESIDVDGPSGTKSVVHAIVACAAGLTHA